LEYRYKGVRTDYVRNKKLSKQYTMSSSITLSTKQLQLVNQALDPSDFLVQFTPAINLGSLGYEIALSKINTWFTAINIVANSTINWSDDGASSWNTITLPAGNYTVADINRLLQESQEDEGVEDTSGSETLYGISIVPNYATNKVEITLDNTINSGANDFRLDLSDGGDPTNIRDFLGYDSQILTSPASTRTTSSGENIANVNAGVDAWQIRTDIHRNAYGDGRTSDVIFQFVPQVPPSGHIAIEPLHLQYHQVNKSTIDSMNIKLTDNLNRKIDLNGEHMVLQFTLRPLQ
jgi:hypothetical protein